ncbi:Histidine-containing phosphotransfer protein 4 [Vitis vinifera]|uniref:Histidine-containing phosphotransfer protein n=1 Tax=Vitis vinifera TaxID=29760 RepID=A0A438CC29_VITVI|nr:Histidine-containing phosphotransfer protein 4 [Vitis vinifera]
MQGYLDEQFVQLEDLQDDANPNFVEEIVTLFYTDSARLIHNIEQALESRPLDFIRLDDYMHQFKGSSSSIGAKKVKNECTQFREHCSARMQKGTLHCLHDSLHMVLKPFNKGGELVTDFNLRCVRTFQQVKQEHTILRRKLETYFQLARQAGLAN